MKGQQCGDIGQNVGTKLLLPVFIFRECEHV